jgi:hypothetical protein
MARASTIGATTIHEAFTGHSGAVTKGGAIKAAEAVTLRRAGKNVVVCGPDGRANRMRAEEIERQANGNIKHCGPHPNAGPHALYHYQPFARPPEGHTFYETTVRKAQ